MARITLTNGEAVAIKHALSRIGNPPKDSAPIPFLTDTVWKMAVIDAAVSRELVPFAIAQSKLARNCRVVDGMPLSPNTTEERIQEVADYGAGMNELKAKEITIDCERLTKSDLKGCDLPLPVLAALMPVIAFLDGPAG